ncbi:LacI family DNA-binding transcriptional regulator [Paragemmobacter straminiformis]|uniref:LacI family DNA-binding transcriptional regulator n=1 Tax=Paragemmobacter straminiformis TaxID=2045119 RepID=A0A842ICD8_9RHOB|nr:LacI family DNA-binding transcriptional regulator [Gemmobacter straminiformis]MBC2837249.1 LacI family DNA-binding transcriptional regulator [Gemmobacter straminiformis]
MASLKDVAERAGVSRSAVSRTFTEGASVAPATRARVLAAAEALGYRPNLLARSLTTRTTGLIGLVSNNFQNPAFLEIFDLFTRGLQERGLRPLLVNLTDELDPARSVGLLRQYSVDGVIVASSTLPTAFARAFREAGLPTVLAFGRVGGLPEVDVVAIDNVAAGRLAAETLLSRGYRRLGFLGGPEGATTTQDRLAGFRAVAGDVTPRFAAAYTFQAGRDAMRAELAAPSEAYFCGDDVLSIGALSALREAGLSVPGDVGLIGVNDMAMAGWDNIRLTTIRQPFAEIVAGVLDVLAELLRTPDKAPEVRVFPCALVERATLRR